jgi:HSP20 family protein
MHMAIDLWRTRPLMSSPMMGRVVDRLFEEAFAPFYGGRDGGGSGTGQPGVQSLPVTIWETEDGFHVALMAPGLDDQSINVTVQEDMLAVEGELKFQPPEGARMIWQEFGPMRFRRAIRLGTALDPSRVEAVYRNGLLLITMPKAEEARPRQVRVQVADSQRTMTQPNGGHNGMQQTGSQQDGGQPTSTAHSTEAGSGNTTPSS